MRDRADVDLYGMLGVTRDATAREIRRAYRRLARQHHPDLNQRPDGSRQFVELARAYEILHDPVQRARYDHTLARSVAASPRSARREPAQPMTVDGCIVRRGILELSPEEAWYVAQHALVLRDADGRTMILPAGTRHGDQVTMLHQGRAAVLTVSMRAKT